MTCKDCKFYKKCMERSREYPCREFEKEEKGNDRLVNGRGSKEDSGRYTDV